MSTRSNIQGTGKKLSNNLADLQHHQQQLNNTLVELLNQNQYSQLGYHSAGFFCNSHPSTGTPSLVSVTPSPTSSIETGNLVINNEIMYNAGQNDGAGNQRFPGYAGNALAPEVIQPVVPCNGAMYPGGYNMLVMQPQQGHPIHPPNMYIAPAPYGAYLPSQPVIANAVAVANVVNANNAAIAMNKNSNNVRKQNSKGSSNNNRQQQQQAAGFNQTSKANATNFPGKAKNQQGNKNQMLPQSQTTGNPSYQLSLPTQAQSTASPLFSDLADPTSVRVPSGFNNDSLVDSWLSTKTPTMDSIFSKKNGESDLSNLTNGVEDKYFNDLWSNNMFPPSSKSNDDGDKLWSGINGASNANTAPSLNLADSLSQSFGSLLIEDKNKSSSWEQRSTQLQSGNSVKEYKDKFSEVIELFRTTIERSATSDWQLCQQNFELFLNMLKADGSGKLESSWSSLDRRSLTQFQSLQTDLLDAATKFREDRTVLESRLEELKDRFKNLFTVGTVGGPNEDVKMLSEALAAGWLQETLRDLSLLNSKKHNSVFIEMTQFFKRTIKMVPNDLLNHLPLLNLLANQGSLEASERQEMEDAAQAYQKLVFELNLLRDKRHARLKAEIGDGLEENSDNSTFAAKAGAGSTTGSVASATMASIVSSGVGAEQKLSEPLAQGTSADSLPKSRGKIEQVKHSEHQFLLNQYYVQVSPSMCKPGGTLLVQANSSRSQVLSPGGLVSEQLENELSKTFKRKVDLFVDDGQKINRCKSLDKLLESLKPRFPELTMESLRNATKRAKMMMAKKGRKQFSFSGMPMKEVVKLVEEYIHEHCETQPKTASAKRAAPKVPVGTVPWSKVAANQHAPPPPPPSQQRPTPTSTPLNTTCGWSSVSSTPTGPLNLSRSSTPGIKTGLSFSASVRGTGGGNGGEDGKCDICLQLLPPMSNAKGPAKTTACHHVFHATCFDLWIKNNPNCPFCGRVLSKHNNHINHNDDDFPSL